ncbi:hypothetical protein BAUCODRAFT_78266 [Baudoinia panamericana UAMH 10762]|uniref:FAD-binding PCMH-type domain-containing protein n=1 Tax=Baudoinia panamericana (strain UAMH 10762) TaxID=717646 RepID=M2N193_BAUPA|nr:uncharacterized protein BAUCODRAFT_78266 [Baudoinia panamericana UAMH 10762]EMC92405.1 hypothetical protein BAUCODRAFT_78266 [Baudoinia panamericana UAMH 10762]
MASTQQASELPDTPTLPNTHSGIPTRLLDKARRAKTLIWQGRSVPASQIPRTEPALPQGVSRTTFNTAIVELTQQLGAANVELNDKPAVDNGWYMEHPNTHDMMHVTDEDALVASAAVYPSSTAEVQLIVRWANQYRIPIFPISMGRNLGYGGAAPRVRGSVVVDLGKRMSNILNIDPDDYTCLLEPGVSFYALYEAIKAKGYDHMWVDTPDLGGGSVIGNTLDRGVGYTPYGDHWATHAGLEVVLPTGEIIRTGMGALPGSNTWQAFPYGFGPVQDGLFSQSNFGIVTKMGMTLMPNPGGHESFMYAFERDSDLAPLIEIIRPLRICNVLENVAQVRSAVQTIAVQGRPRTDFFTGSGAIPQEVIDKEVSKLPCGKCAWLYYGMSYGPAYIRQYKLDAIDKEFRKIPGARKVDPQTIPRDNYFWSRDQIAAGVPDLEELLWCNWVPNGSHIAFSPVSPIRGKDAKQLMELARRRHTEHKIDLFPAFCVGLREMHLIVEIVFDKTKPEARKAAMDCMRGMVDDAAKLGYGEYRTHLALMDQVAGTYNWNDNALMKLNERLKDALDPQGILAPGKSGIWPKRYRARGWEMGVGDEGVEGKGVEPEAGSVRL